MQQMTKLVVCAEDLYGWLFVAHYDKPGIDTGTAQAIRLPPNRMPQDYLSRDCGKGA